MKIDARTIGTRSAEAINDGQHATYQHWQRHLCKMLAALDRGDDRSRVLTAYFNAYRVTRIGGEF